MFFVFVFVAGLRPPVFRGSLLSDGLCSVVVLGIRYSYFMLCVCSIHRCVFSLTCPVCSVLMGVFLTVVSLLFQAVFRRWIWFPTCTGSRPSCSQVGSLAGSGGSLTGSVGSVGGSVGIGAWLCGDRRLSVRRARRSGPKNPTVSPGRTFRRKSGISI